MKKTFIQDKTRVIVIVIISLLVIITGGLYAFKAFTNGDIVGGIVGLIISVTIFGFAISVFLKGNKDLKKGFPLHDERSKKVMQKASSRAFFVSLYLLLAVGFLSEDLITFRDVSQATGITVGIMALLFAGFWVYYSRQEL